MMLASGRGHKEVVRLLVRKGCNMRTLDEQRNNILHIASIGGHVDMVKYILSQNIVDIDSTASIGRTPVMIAAAMGHREVVELLVSKGCNVKTTDQHQNNILHVACIGGFVDVVRYILSQRIVDVESRGFGGKTCLLLGAEVGQEEVVKFLRNWGCNISATDTQNITCFMLLVSGVMSMS